MSFIKSLLTKQKSPSSSEHLSELDQYKNKPIHLLSDASSYGYIFQVENTVLKILFMGSNKKLEDKQTLSYKDISKEIALQRRSGAAPKIFAKTKLLNTSAINFIKDIKENVDASNPAASMTRSALSKIEHILQDDSQISLYVVAMERLRGIQSLHELRAKTYIRINEPRIYNCIIKRIIKLFDKNRLLHLDLHPENIFVEPCMQGHGCDCKFIDYGVTMDLLEPPQATWLRHFRHYANGLSYSEALNNASKSKGIEHVVDVLQILAAADMANKSIKKPLFGAGAFYSYPQCYDLLEYIYGKHPYNPSHPVFQKTIVPKLRETIDSASASASASGTRSLSKTISRTRIRKSIKKRI